MGAMSLSHIVVVAVLVVLLFGRGKVSELMADLGKGIRSFKKEIADQQPQVSTPGPRDAAEIGRAAGVPPDASDGRA